jgi:O-antigen ligase
MLLGVFAPVLFMRELTRNSRLKSLLLGVLCVLIVGLLLTGSRGAVLAMAVIVAWYLWRYRRGRTFLLILTLLMIGVALAPDAVRDRLATGLDDKPSAGVADVGVTRNDGLTAGRVFMYKQLAPEVLRSPLFGRGLSSTQWSSAVKSGIYSANHPHNLYLEILMDGGLMLAASMFLFYRYAWRKFMQIGNDERYPLELRGFCLGGAGGLIAMLIYGTGNGHWYPAPEQIFFWVSLGIAIGAARWVTDSAGIGSQPSPIDSYNGIIPGPQLKGVASRILA